jgi:hypothetical protein
VSLGERASGGGAVAASDGSGAVRALVNGESGGMVVFDANKAYQAGVVVGSDGIPRVAIWSGDTRVAVMTVDVANGKAGLLEINSPAGKTAARVSSGSDGAGAVKVMGAAGRPVAGVLGNAASGGTVVVATPAGQSLAQMSVSSDGRGLVQIFGRGDRPVAVLTQATETPGGLLQISNTAGPVANVTVSSRGGGYFQLNDASGRPTVEGGTLPSGLGMLRAGPAYKCAPAQASTPIIAVGLPDCIVGASSK